MSPTEIYDEYAIQFPPVWPQDHDWIYVHDGRTVNQKAVSNLISRYISDQEVIVVVHSNPGIGAILPQDQATMFIEQHVGQEIQVSNQVLNAFVAISKVGVGTGWAL